MLGIATQVRDQWSRFGAARASRYFAWRVANRLAGYMPYQGFVLPASRTRVRAAAAPNGIVCREVELLELAASARDPAYELSERFLAEARARGDCCIGVFAGARLVSYSFNSRIPTNIDSGFRYGFPEGWVYHFRAFTLPEWRGQKLHSLQMPAILQKFGGAAGFKGVTTLVVATNYGSLASFSRLYFEPVFRFTIVGKGTRRRMITEPPDRVSRVNGTMLFRAQRRGEIFAVEKVEGA